MVGLYLGYSIYSPMLLGVFDTPYMVSDFLKEREAVVNSLPVKPRTATYVIESARCTLDPPAVEYVGSVNVKDKVKRSDGSDDIKEYRYFFKELTINELFKEFNTKDMDTLYTVYYSYRLCDKNIFKKMVAENNVFTSIGLAQEFMQKCVKDYAAEFEKFKNATVLGWEVEKIDNPNIYGYVMHPKDSTVVATHIPFIELRVVPVPYNCNFADKK